MSIRDLISAAISVTDISSCIVSLSDGHTRFGGIEVGDLNWSYSFSLRGDFIKYVKRSYDDTIYI